MQIKSLSTIIKQQIRKELRRKEIIKDITTKVAQQDVGLYSSLASNLSQDKLEQQILPLLMALFNKRIVSGGVPVKLVNETGLKLYVSSMVVVFDSEEEIISISGQEITLQSFTEDRWVYVYFNKDETFTVNKYPPFIGTNVDRIIICKVWIESGAITYDGGMIRDLRQVGVASANLNHVLRQAFIDFMKAAPATIIDSISVIPYIYPSGEEPSGGSGLYVKVGSIGDKLFYAKLNPIPDTIIEFILPESGETKNYYIVCSAQVSTDDPDDFKWNIKAIENTEDLKIYEIPVAIVKEITADTFEITDSMIETIGYQRTKNDYFDYTLEYKKSGVINEGVIDLPQLIQYQSKIHRILIYLGQFSSNDSGGIESGETASLDFNVIVNGQIKFSFKIDYDSTKETEIIYDKLVDSLLEFDEDAKIKPRDIVKIEMTTNFPSGCSFSYDNLVVKLLCGKLYYG